MGFPLFLVSLKDLPAPAGIQPCVAVSRGLDTAARTYNAPLFIHLTMVYFSAGVQVRVRTRVALKDTIQGLDLDDQTVTVDIKIDSQIDGTPVPPVAAKSPVTASVRLIYVDAQTGADLEVIEPQITQTTVP